MAGGLLLPESRLFGTDGVRGRANSQLGPVLAMELGRAAGDGLSGQVFVGRDTRRSGEMLSSALQAGFHSVGVDTVDVGILPTAGIAALARAAGGSLAAAVSASHNPAEDNGIKFFGGDGSKLSDEAEDRIEARLRSGPPWPTPTGAGIGMRLVMSDAVTRYVDELAAKASFSLRGLEVAIDCANGAAAVAAPALLRRLHVDVETHFAEPDGTNINHECGATRPEVLARLSRGRIGLAFDGDADRLVAIDEDGVPVNGDVIMAIVARRLKEEGRLRNGVVVATVMSNLGFRRAMADLGIEVATTRVGDRYVLEEMRRRKAVLGGEQSGHVIFGDVEQTGDGLFTALRLLEVVAATGRPLTELRTVMSEYPQVLRNVRVAHKERLEQAENLWTAVRQAEADMAGDGRILVRASGTEPLVRVMVEADTAPHAAALADELAAVVRAELGE